MEKKKRKGIHGGPGEGLLPIREYRPPVSPTDRDVKHIKKGLTLVTSEKL